MAVRGNIGNIKGAIEKGIKAESLISYGSGLPMPINHQMLSNSLPEVSNKEFVWLIHRWCDAKRVVSA